MQQCGQPVTEPAFIIVISADYWGKCRRDGMITMMLILEDFPQLAREVCPPTDLGGLSPKGFGEHFLGDLSPTVSRIVRNRKIENPLTNKKYNQNNKQHGAVPPTSSPECAIYPQRFWNDFSSRFPPRQFEARALGAQPQIA